MILINFDDNLSDAKKVLEKSESNIQLKSFYQDSVFHEIDAKLKMAMSMRNSVLKNPHSSRNSESSGYQNQAFNDRLSSSQHNEYEENYSNGGPYNGTGGNSSRYRNSH